METNGIQFKYGNDLDLDQVIELYKASTLGERRPVNDRQTMSDMLHHAKLVVTAWRGGLLIGIAWIQKTREKMGPRSSIVLLAAPKATEYYSKIGFSKHPSAWILQAIDPLPSLSGDKN